MPAAAVIGGATILSAGLSAKASKKAANAQVQAADRASQTQEDIFNKQTALQEPFRQAGITAQDRLLTLLGLTPANDSGLSVSSSSPDFGKYAGDFGMNDFQRDPGYQFRLDEGMKALNNSMAARGLGISGANIKGALNYGQNAASQEYQNAFNRYQVNRSNQLNPLQSLAGQGQTATNALSGAAQNYGNNVADLQTQAGNARASGYVGGANALTSALSGGFNAYSGYQNANALNTFLNGSPSGGFTPGVTNLAAPMSAGTLAPFSNLLGTQFGGS